LTWLIFGLAMWLSVGVLAAQLFGASANGQRDPDEDGDDVRSSAQ
jgi:hypothetical protein